MEREASRSSAGREDLQGRAAQRHQQATQEYIGPGYSGTESEVLSRNIQGGQPGSFKQLTGIDGWGAERPLQEYAKSSARWFGVAMRALERASTISPDDPSTFIAASADNVLEARLLMPPRIASGGNGQPTLKEPVSELLYGARPGEGLPGYQGVAIPKRPTALELENLTAKHGVEFAVTYKYGPGRSGRGGQYYLHSGTPTSAPIPLEADRMLITHTHPRGRAYASSGDRDVMKYLENLGSPQRTSQVIPVGRGFVIRFTALENRL